MATIKLPSAAGLEKSAAIFLLTQGFAIFALIFAFNSVVLAPATYTSFMSQNGMYAQISSAVANNIVMGLPEGAMIAPPGDMVNRISNYLPENYIEEQTGIFITGTIDYVAGRSAYYNPSINLVPIRGKVSQAIIESYISTRGLDITSPEQQSIIALQQQSIASLIPETIDRQQIEKSQTAAAAFGKMVAALDTARGYFAMLNAFMLAAGIISALAAVALFALCRNAYEFFKAAWKPVAVCGAEMVVISIALPFLGAGIAGNALSGYAADAQTVAAISKLLAYMLTSIGVTNALFGAAAIIAGGASYALAKYVFSPPELLA
ncbi:MAG TPA: hypothetical protein PLO51_05965, partial [Candidatus Micrarchaeota archaeon]|nr:hypothetical protein [Candidatus Micrarchaeota archaeon]